MVGSLRSSRIKGLGVGEEEDRQRHARRLGTPRNLEMSRYHNHSFRVTSLDLVFVIFLDTTG